jgi:hypothetical protein
LLATDGYDLEVASILPKGSDMFMFLPLVIAGAATIAASVIAQPKHWSSALWYFLIAFVVAIVIATLVVGALFQNTIL